MPFENAPNGTEEPLHPPHRPIPYILIREQARQHGDGHEQPQHTDSRETRQDKGPIGKETDSNSDIPDKRDPP